MNDNLFPKVDEIISSCYFGKTSMSFDLFVHFLYSIKNSHNIIFEEKENKQIIITCNLKKEKIDE